MKIDRLLAMTVMLLNRERVTAKEFAERFEVSTKTVYRDMDTLNQAGIPIVAYQGIAGGYGLMGSFTMDRQLVSVKELSMLLAAAKGIHHALEDRTLSELLEKVEALLQHSDATNQALVLDLLPWGHNANYKDKVSLLREAIEDRRVVVFQYMKADNTSSKRTVEPTALILKGSHWYIQAFCRQREDFRVFRLSRIMELALHSDRFEQRIAPLMEGYTWSSQWYGQAEEEVGLLFNPEMRRQVNDSFPPEYVTFLEDGYMRVQGLFIVDEWFYGMLLSFGERVLVEHPASLAQEIQARAAKIMLRYTT